MDAKNCNFLDGVGFVVVFLWISDDYLFVAVKLVKKRREY
jgi:hypothetical protein